MYQLMDDQNASDEDSLFFKKLLKGELWEDYIVSHWHEKHSTTRTLHPDHLTVIKTTINHFTIQWMQTHFPEIALWGIWRAPMDILSSIHRNGFYDAWYSDALPQVAETVQQHEVLRKSFGKFLGNIANTCQATAFLIAVRSYYYAYYLPENRMVDYPSFRLNPNIALKPICEAYDLESHDFRKFAAEDLNVTGQAFNPSKKGSTDWLETADRRFCEVVFEPLIALYEYKFHSS